MIAGLEDITSGEIEIGDRLVNNVAPGQRDIAMVFQNYALYPHMSVYQNMAFLVPAMTLIFYGMALLNASKYVHNDIKYLALSQMILGTIAIFTLDNPESGFILWTAGFGVMHIVYGTIMYFKYDRKKI